MIIGKKFKITSLLFILGTIFSILYPSFSMSENYQIVRSLDNLSFNKPVSMERLPTSDSWLVAEQRGVIWRVDDKGSVSLFSDLRNIVDSRFPESGLLSMAFHPNFNSNNKIFISYTRAANPLESIISEFTANDDLLSLDVNSEKITFNLSQPYSNHNGGHIAFGPDGYLYIGFGDGGAGGDPEGHGQNTNTHLGAIIRINVDLGASYIIPDDNPFINGGGNKEIYAWGLRNPWRFSFDTNTGDLWLADVGQRDWEEINIINNGKNYGWKIREGRNCFSASRCVIDQLTDPIHEYSHEEGCSVTGGYVYRGELMPNLMGLYIFGDYCNGKIWALENISGSYSERLLIDSSLLISSFAQDIDGDIYILDHRSGGIYQLILE